MSRVDSVIQLKKYVGGSVVVVKYNFFEKKKDPFEEQAN